MSIYFNYQIEANRDENKIATDNLILKSGSIVDEQDGYQIGVARFKIPITNIPLMRIYEDDFNLGYIFTGANSYKSLVANNQLFHYPSIINNSIFTGDNIWTNSGKYGIDTLNGNKRFIDINSQVEFVDLLNQALGRSFFQTAESYNANNFTGTNAAIVVAGAGGATLGGVVGDGLTEVCNFTVPPTAAVGGSLVGSIISDFSLNIKKLTATAADILDFSQLDFIIRKYEADGSTLINEFKVNTSILRDTPCVLDASVTPKTEIRIGVGRGYQIESQTQFDSTLYDAHKANEPFSEPFSLYSTNFDIRGLQGQRLDNTDGTTNAIWRVLVRNKSYINKLADPTSAAVGISVTIPVEGISLNLNGIKLSDSNLYYQSQSILPQENVRFLTPQFQYDEITKKIIYFSPQMYAEDLGVRLYMNTALSQMISFESYQCTDIDSIALINKYLNLSVVTQVQANKYIGKLYNFPANVFRLDFNNGVNGRTKSDYVAYYEARDTTFARDWLDAIIVTSGSIATQGEIVGNGTSTRKVITDFKLDPSTIGRDYLVYQPDGGIRYYPLDSTQPLRNIDIQIFFQDKLGFLRSLLVPPKMLLSMKLEFRPNNMINNY